MSKVAAIMSQAGAAKKAADDAETERLRTRSFDTRAQPEGRTYTHAAVDEDEETLGSGKLAKRSASRAILG